MKKALLINEIGEEVINDFYSKKEWVFFTYSISGLSDSAFVKLHEFSESIDFHPSPLSERIGDVVFLSSLPSKM